MHLRQLVYLRALAQERHFGRAASACRVSQPTLSAALKHLEAELAVPIVQRGRRFEGFTPEGLRVVDWAQRILAACDGLNQEIGQMRRGLVGHLRIGAIPTAISMVPRLTTPFHARHPLVRLTVLSQTSNQIQRAIDNFEIDIGLTYLDNEPLARVRTLPLYRERYVLVTPKDGALGRRRKIAWAEAAERPLCLLTPDMQNRRIIDQMLFKAGVTVSTTLESNSMIVLYAHVRSGRWASIMPALLAETLGLTDRVRAIPIVEPENVHSIGLVTVHRDPMSPLTGALLDMARHIAGTLPAPRV